MSVVALERKIVLNAEGEPTEVVIPYDKFVDFIETYGLDLSEEDETSIREARADYKAGNREAFISHEDLKCSLKCTE